jgi:hypothetical protein
MEHLVEERVDTFWKGLENVALKRGQVCRGFFISLGRLMQTVEGFCHTFKKGPKEGVAWDHNVRGTSNAFQVEPHRD